MQIPTAWFVGLHPLARPVFSGQSRGGTPGGCVMGSGQTACMHTVRSQRDAVSLGGHGDDSGQYEGGIWLFGCLCPGASVRLLGAGSYRFSDARCFFASVLEQSLLHYRKAWSVVDVE